MTTLTINCPECSCEFIVHHEMDEDKYKPCYCVFCQAEIFEDDLVFKSDEYIEDYELFE